MAFNIELSKVEDYVLKLWERDNVIDKIIKASKERSEVVFLDGPPFATGTMHYGHMLVSTVKDSITRALTMSGFKVERISGSDTHGIPIEHLVKKKIGYNTTEELIAFGIDKHNKICRDLINECCDTWKTSFSKIGRWIDPAKQYKTMDLSYMESVMWVFSELYRKGLIYEGYKVMPYSVGCGTTLSNFEAKQAYKEVVDKSASIKFLLQTVPTGSKLKLDTNKQTYIIAWTTTPWTLPSNMALCTAPSGTLIKCLHTDASHYLIMSEAKYATLDSTKYLLVEKLETSDVIGGTYATLYSAADQISPKFGPIISDPYVKMEGDGAGTGFVHIAPAYGEDDFRIGCANNLVDRKIKSSIINPIGADGKFDQTFSQFAGLSFEESNKVILKDLSTRNLVFDTKDYRHSYPFCDRSGCRLIYRVDTAWFVAASNPDLRQRMIDFNSKINWAPSNIGSGQFRAWLEEPVDWCISRNRFWGTPLPIWKSDDGEEIICVSSVEELETLSGIKVDDLHIEYVDKIKIPSRMGKGMLTRVSYVLDCWFESGSAAVAERHYPFENKESFDARIAQGTPIVDFITESIDQCRGWFYVQLVLMTALFDRAPFGNVIVTGIINAADGQKMSKSKANYDDPSTIIETYGADVLRLYLLDTPVIKATSIKFDANTLFKMQQASVVKLYNMTKLLLEKCELAFHKTNSKIVLPSHDQIKSFSNILDRWILNKAGLLAQKMKLDFMSYKLTSTSNDILVFIEQLTNWYVKMARERLKSCNTEALQTLMYILLQFSKMIAPVMPFISEFIYHELKKFFVGFVRMEEALVPENADAFSVHAESYPTADDFISDPTLEAKFDMIQRIIILVRDLRINANVNNKFPLKMVEIGFIDKNLWDQISDVLSYVQDESNVVEISRMTDCSGLLEQKLVPQKMQLSTYLKSIGLATSMNEVMKFISELSGQPLTSFLTTGNATLSIKNLDVKLDLSMVRLTYNLLTKVPNVKNSNDIVVRVDATKSKDIMEKYLIKLIGQAIQMHRKQRGMKPWDIIRLTYYSTDIPILDFMQNNLDTFVCENVLSIKFASSDSQKPKDKVTTHDIEIGGSIEFASDF
jgi:isoleucyl-tRNA synthetase